MSTVLRASLSAIVKSAAFYMEQCRMLNHSQPRSSYKACLLCPRPVSSLDARLTRVVAINGCKCNLYTMGCRSTFLDCVGDTAAVPAKQLLYRWSNSPRRELRLDYYCCTAVLTTANKLVVCTTNLYQFVEPLPYMEDLPPT